MPVARSRRLQLLLQVVLSIAAGLTACSRGEPVAVEPGVSERLAKHRAAILSDLQYRLELSIPRDATEDITGRIAIEVTVADARAPLQVDFRESADKLLRSTVNGDDVELRVEDEHIVIPPEQLREGPNELRFEFIAGSSSLNRNPDFLYTLFVPDRARTAFPLFDQPDLKARWELRLDIPEDWNALSSAPVLASDVRDGRRRIRFGGPDRLPPYLFSFVAGRFETLRRDLGARSMTVLHRETDAAKIARNIDDIFALHRSAVDWLEDYTGIPFPYEKLDIAVIPAHPYGGMEHVGAIQYRADSLWLDEGASQARLLGRASLIAHEVAHMWFGNLVTMRWFDDVWTKEVFANFMAAKIVNPSFPEIDHELSFLLRHHPRAYAVDRSAGANPIRQSLANLDQAGQLYGAIIYNKAPIMMRQLELLLGEDAFRDGLRRYLRDFSHGNASWPELIAILDELSDEDLASWSDTWVHSAGRGHFTLADDEGRRVLEQRDPDGRGRIWPQSFTIATAGLGAAGSVAHVARGPRVALNMDAETSETALLFNANGYGYGLFPAELSTLAHWRQLEPTALASLLINLHEQMLEQARPTPLAYLRELRAIVAEIDNELILDRALTQLRQIYWTLIPDAARSRLAAELETEFWENLQRSEAPSLRKIHFEALASITMTPPGLARLRSVWAGELVVEQLPLGERDLIELCITLAIKLPDSAEALLREQTARITNPDQRRRLAYLAAPLSTNEKIRDTFFASLAEERQRETESWVLDALGILHHPLRVADSERYLQPSLELLEEIQKTGDIFFPAGWLRATLANHHSDRAVEIVTNFLGERPDYNPQLAMKLRQAADPLHRANRLRQR